MITKTLNLDNDYQKLFNEVLEVSKAKNELDPDSPIIDINNLGAFFGSIKEIAALDSKFLRLPLDEPLFEIDANSRKINVPAEFKSNGVSVLGDHLAEIIFFRIARFFDYKDLSTCDILINWKMGAKEGKTTRFIKFDDVMVEPDETKTECVIFGWPINDIVTETSGALTFAVEFRNESTSGEVLYRFNTLPITVNIKDGLILGENIESYTLDQDIMDNLVNSAFGEGTAAVNNVSWLTGNGNGLVLGVGSDDNIILQDFASTIQLPTIIEAGVPSSVPVNLYAQAYVDEGTEVQYQLPATLEMLKVNRPLVEVELSENNNELDESLVYFLDEEGTIVADIDNLPADTQVLYKVAPLIENLKYYKVVEGSDPVAYELANEDDLATWGKKPVEEVVEDEEVVVPGVTPTVLYLAVGKIVADIAKDYYIDAQGVKYDKDHRKIGSGEVASTAIVSVPAALPPVKIDIETSMRPELLDAGYSFAEGTENVVFLVNGMSGTITAIPDVNTNSGAFQYTWLKKNGNNFEPISEESVPFVQNVLSDTLEVEDEGEYKVSIVNFINGVSANPALSAAITVSTLAGIITNVPVKYTRGSVTGMVVPNTDIKYDSANSNLFLRKLDLIVDVENIAIEGKVGTLKYQWYKEITSFNETEEVRSYEALNGQNTATLSLTGGSGYFVLEVQNDYNGSIYTYRTDTINVVDNAST